MTDRYVVIGNPIAHSKSPMIHADFARQLDVDLQYCKLFSPMNGFEQTVKMLQAAGVKGANVTVPFKQEAWRLAQKPSAAVQFAQAANTLRFGTDGIEADNTDGIGLCTDLNRLLQLQGQQLSGATVVMLGAGGAASGCVSAFKDAGVAELFVLNRTVDKAVDLAVKANGIGLKAHGLSLSSECSVMTSSTHKVVLVNASSSSLSGQAVPISNEWFQSACLAYDMMYAQQPTPFMKQALGVNPEASVADGLGMLVFQAAAAFEFWTGLKPHAADTLARMRNTLQIKQEASA
ncbi:MAG: shikimate dehydrogenase [Limnobacter sp.]|nr:shikimate dehydrogenase [Limnobacter sp.]